MELNIGIAMLAEMKQTKNTERFDIVEIYQKYISALLFLVGSVS